jgi:nucleoside phosphorylase
MTTTPRTLDLGIVVALPEELRVLLDLAGSYTSHADPDLRAYLFARGPYHCAAFLAGDMGQGHAVRVTERVIPLWDPASIVTVGVTGGVHDDLRVGDVHVPAQAVEYMQDAKASPTEAGGFAIVPGPPAYRPDFALLDLVRAFEFTHPDAYQRWLGDGRADLASLVPNAAARDKLFDKNLVRPDVRLLADGHVATGPVVGAAAAFSAWIRSHDRNVKSLEMESAAVLLAAQTRHDPRRALAIRAISDLGDQRKKALDRLGGGALRQYAMRNAVRLLFALLDAGAWPQESQAAGVPARGKAPPEVSIGRLPVTSHGGLPQPPRPFFVHPYNLQAHFTGRIAERQMLGGWLKEERGSSILVLVAMGGMGKSALTWRWLWEDVAPGSLEGVLWWSFYDSESSLPRLVDTALEYLTGQPRDAVTSADYDKVQELLVLLADRRVLLVLDGFERQLVAYANLGAVYREDEATPSAADGRACVDPRAARFLRSLAAIAPRAKVLVTTRLMIGDLEDEIGAPLVGCRREDLESLNRDDAVAFMQAQGVQGAPHEIADACERYGFHPLSLRLLSGYVVHDKQRPCDIATAPKYDVVARLQTRRHHVLEIAYEALGKPQQRLLSQISAFRCPVEYDAVAVLDGRAVDELDADLQELIERGLLFFDVESCRYDLHPVVRSYAYHRLIDPKETHNRAAVFFERSARAQERPTRTIDDIMPVIELYHHLVHGGRFAAAAKICESRLTGVMYFELAVYPEYARLCEDFIKAASDAEVSPRDVLRVKNRLAVTHQKMGLLRLALAELREVRDASVGVEPNLVHRASNNIAQIERDLGMPSQSAADFLAAIVGARREHDSLEQARAMQESAMLDVLTGSLDAAASKLQMSGHEVRADSIPWRRAAAGADLRG